MKQKVYMQKISYKSTAKELQCNSCLSIERRYCTMAKTILVKLLQVIIFFGVPLVKSSIFDAVINSMEEDGKIFCALMMSSTSQGYTSYNVPVMAIDFHDPPEDVKKTSNLCMHHIVVLKNKKELDQITKTNFKVKIKID